MAKRRITMSKVKDAPGFYKVAGGGDTVKVAGKERAKEIKDARQRLRAKGRR